MRRRGRQTEPPRPEIQKTAANSKAKTIAKPTPEPTCKINSTGSKETMAKATAPDDQSTPRKLNRPDQTTANCAGSEWVYMTVATALAGMKAVHELKAKGDQERDARNGRYVVTGTPVACTSV